MFDSILNFIIIIIIIIIIRFISIWLYSSSNVKKNINSKVFNYSSKKVRGEAFHHWGYTRESCTPPYLLILLIYTKHKNIEMKSWTDPVSSFPRVTQTFPGMFEDIPRKSLATFPRMFGNIPLNV